MTDRRVYFCFGAVLALALVYPLVPEQFRWVPAVFAAIYLVFGMLFGVSNIAARSGARDSGHL